jgi:hypothetical protein
MKKDRKDSASNKLDLNQSLSKRQSRREILLKTGGILAAGAFGAVPLRGWAADPVNIGALYPTTGRKSASAALLPPSSRSRWSTTRAASSRSAAQNSISFSPMCRATPR